MTGCRLKKGSDSVLMCQVQVGQGRGEAALMQVLLATAACACTVCCPVTPAAAARACAGCSLEAGHDDPAGHWGAHKLVARHRDGPDWLLEGHHGGPLDKRDLRTHTQNAQQAHTHMSEARRLNQAMMG